MGKLRILEGKQKCLSGQCAYNYILPESLAAGQSWAKCLPSLGIRFLVSYEVNVNAFFKELLSRFKYLMI